MIQTPEQQYFLTRLLGFSFSVEYKRGSDNATVDALSRLPLIREEFPGEFMLLASTPIFGWMKEIREENATDLWILDIKAKIEAKEAKSDYTIIEGILYFRFQFCIGPNSKLRQMILTEFHDSRIGGHSGYYCTLCQILDKIFWKGMNQFIRTYVAGCQIC